MNAVVKREAAVPKKASPKQKYSSLLNGKSTLKKCFSSPHLKDLNNLEPTHSTSSNSRANEGSAFRDEVINCRFRSCGCKVRLSRERMDSHLRTNAATHSLLILNKIDALSRQNEQICKRLKSVEENMSSMAQLFENLQEVLANKGIPSKDPFGIGKPMYGNAKLEPGADPFGMHSSRATDPRSASMPAFSQNQMASELKMMHNFASMGASKSTKRISGHLDLAIPTHPSKRQRKTSQTSVTSTAMPPSYAGSAPSVNSAQTGGTLMQAQQRGGASGVSMPSSSMATHMPGNVSQHIVHPSSAAQPMNRNMPNSMPQHRHFAMMPQMGQHLNVNQHMNANTMRNQSQKTGQRSQDGSDSKSTSTKGAARRKPRARVKKGKNLLEAPKKPKTAYNYYQIGVRDSILAETRSEDASATKESQSQKVARIIGERWKSMPDHEREAFNTLALQDKQRYKRELEEYVQLKAQLKQACKGMNPMIAHTRMQDNMMMNGNNGLNNMRVNYGLSNRGVMGMPGPMTSHSAMG